jgi:gas vesicle protein
MIEKKDHHIGILLGGGIIGAIVGIIAAVVLIKSAEQFDETPRLNSKKGLQLGIGLISLIRSLTKFSNS